MQFTIPNSDGDQLVINITAGQEPTFSVKPHEPLQLTAEQRRQQQEQLEAEEQERAESKARALVLARERQEQGQYKTDVSGNLMIFLIRREGYRDFERVSPQEYSEFASGF